MYTGPKIKREDLLFGYDTGEYASANPNRDKHTPHNKRGKGSHRFFKGRPTTNYLANQNAVRQSSYTSYTPTSNSTWLGNHSDAIRAYNAQGTEVTETPNTGVTNWETTHHARHILDEELGKPVVAMNCVDSQWKAWNFAAGMSAWNSYGIAAGDKYVLSWLQWTTHLAVHADAGFYSKNTSNANGFHDGRSGNVSTAKNTKVRTWQRVYCVFTVNSVRNLTNSYGAVYMYGQGNNAAGRELRLADVQLELGTDHPSAFLDTNSGGSTTTRSSTESLIDLSGDYSLNVNNVSFSSKGFMTFDGTDDALNITGTNYPATWDDPFTIEVVGIVPTGATWYVAGSGTGIVGRGSYMGVIGIMRTSTNNQTAFYIRAQDTSYNGDAGVAYATVERDKYFHLTGVYNGNLKMDYYKDGALIQSDTLTSTASVPDNMDYVVGGNISFGGNWGDYGEGTYPVVKVYKRALSASEVKQNFSAYRKRFDI